VVVVHVGEGERAFRIGHSDQHRFGVSSDRDGWPNSDRAISGESA
jgi:hypothetical protein